MSVTSILVVEDERIVARDIKNTLKRLGYVVADCVSTGQLAIEKTEQLQPDLVLMDIVLKGKMDGVQAAQKIRANFDIPVVYLTAHADECTIQRAKLTEPLCYILKPFEDRDLHVAIQIGLYRYRREVRQREREANYLQELQRQLEWRTTRVEELLNDTEFFKALIEGLKQQAYYQAEQVEQLEQELNYTRQELIDTSKELISMNQELIDKSQGLISMNQELISMNNEFLEFYEL